MNKCTFSKVWPSDFLSSVEHRRRYSEECGKPKNVDGTHWIPLYWKESLYYWSQWGLENVWVPAFIKSSSFVRNVCFVLTLYALIIVQFRKGHYMLCIKMVLYVFHNNEVHFPALAFLDWLYTPSQISLHYISLCLLSFVVQTQTFVKLFSLDWLFWERSDIRHIITLSSTVFGKHSLEESEYECDQSHQPRTDPQHIHSILSLWPAAQFLTSI